MTKNNFLIENNNHTPIIKQYLLLKSQYPNMLLFFKWVIFMNYFMTMRDVFQSY